MGVLSIALPSPVPHAVFPKLPVRRPVRPISPPPDAPSSRAAKARTAYSSSPAVAAPSPSSPAAQPHAEPQLRSIGDTPPTPAAHGTLQPPLTSAEGRVSRTPEQLAEQEATVRLVRRCLTGDAEAWQQLVVAQHRRLYSVCYRFTGSASDADDLTQDAFLKIYTNLASFDAAKGSFQTWAMTLTRNLLVDHFRRTRLQRATDSLQETINGEADAPTLLDQLADHRSNQEQHVAGQELRVQVQAALKHLSPELREAVILRDLEDMDYREIAQVLRIPEGTVKSRISRGRGELARLLQRTEGQVV